MYADILRKDNSMSASIELSNSQVYSDLTPIELIDHAVKNSEGIIAANGALRIITGKRTGRSPLDRFIVKDHTTLKRAS